MSDDDFGSEIEYDAVLEETLQAVESGKAVSTSASKPITDIEDLTVGLSPFQQFRKRGSLSVTDLVGTLWCEVQFD